MTIDWNIAIKIWAIVGPLIAAAASAMWARRNLTKDREFDISRDEVRNAREIAQRESEHRRDLQTDIYRELKSALAGYVSATNEYVLKKSVQLTNPTPENIAAADTIYEKWNHNCQLITLLGDSELSDLAVDFWNKTLPVPCNYNAPPDDYAATLGPYKQAKAAFILKARVFLAQQRGV